MKITIKPAFIKPLGIIFFALALFGLALPMLQFAVLLMPNTYPLQVEVFLMAVSFVPSIVFMAACVVLRKRG